MATERYRASFSSNVWPFVTVYWSMKYRSLDQREMNQTKGRASLSLASKLRGEFKVAAILNAIRGQSSAIPLEEREWTQTNKRDVVQSVS